MNNLLYVHTPERAGFGADAEIEATLEEAMDMAEKWFKEDPNAIRLEETFSPNDGYTAKVYGFSIDATNRKRDLLIFRVSNIGPKPTLIKQTTKQ